MGYTTNVFGLIPSYSILVYYVKNMSSSFAYPPLHPTLPPLLLRLLHLSSRGNLVKSIRLHCIFVNIPMAISHYKTTQLNKRTKYSTFAARLRAELLPFSVATYSGLVNDADHWGGGRRNNECVEQGGITRYTLSAIAATIQRGNARVMLAGQMQSLRTG